MRSKIRQEVLDQAIHNCDQVMQGWEQRFRLSSPNFADRFDSGRQSVIIHLRSTPRPEEIHVARFVKEFLVLPARSRMTNDDFGDIQNQPVLTKVVELVQECKRFVAARVGLYSLDKFYCVRMNQLFYSFDTGFATGLVIRQREIDISQNVISSVRSVSHDKLKREMVEGSDQVSDNVPSGAEDIEGNIVGVDAALLALKRLDLSIGSMGISQKLIKGDFHVDQVLFGPIDLGAN